MLEAPWRCTISCFLLTNCDGILNELITATFSLQTENKLSNCKQIVSTRIDFRIAINSPANRKDVFLVVASLLFFGGREATTGNTSAVRGLTPNKETVNKFTPRKQKIKFCSTGRRKVLGRIFGFLQWVAPKFNNIDLVRTFEKIIELEKKWTMNYVLCILRWET